MSEEIAIKKYVIVSGGVVINTIFTDPGFMEMLANNTVVDVTNEPTASEITEGYTYENGVFSAPIV
jgi:hypothetical protein